MYQSVVTLLDVCSAVYGTEQVSTNGPASDPGSIVNKGPPAMSYPSNTYDRAKLAKIPNSQPHFDLDKEQISKKMKESVDIEVKNIEIDAHHDDQAYDSKEFGLEAACPPGSPSERLRGCGLDISSYLLSAPSQVFMKPKMLLNCKLTDGKLNINNAWTRVNDNSSVVLTDHTRRRPLMGTKILTTRFQQTQTSDEVVQIDFSKYVLNAESKNIQVYDVVTPEREITPIKDEHEGKICLKEFEEIQTNEQEMKGKKTNEEKNEKKSSHQFLQRCFDLFERVRRFLKSKRKKKTED